MARKSVNVFLSALKRLRQRQREQWKLNARISDVIPRALRLIYLRAATNDSYARRLVFDHYKIEGYVNQESSQSEILQAVNLCLQLLEDEFEDGLHLTEKDWVRLEEVVAL